MPRFFAQAQQQALAGRRRSIAVPDASMKSAKEQESGAQQGIPNGLQGAIAQMESNAAAAMARFKSFRTAGPPKEDLEPTPSRRSEDTSDSPSPKLRSDSAPAEALSGHGIADKPVLNPSRFATIEIAARRYLHAENEGRPWHHELKGTPWQWISDVLDQPGALVAAAGACLVFGWWDWLWPLIYSIFSVQRLSTVVGVVCLFMAVSGWLLRTGAFMRAQLSAFADTVPRMPHACEEMSEMLVELKLMRHDLKSMKAKVAWLPGGE